MRLDRTPSILNINALGPVDIRPKASTVAAKPGAIAKGASFLSFSSNSSQPQPRRLASGPYRRAKNSVMVWNEIRQRSSKGGFSG